MRTWLQSVIIFAYFWMDITISIISIGFFTTPFQFNAQIIWDYLQFKKSYNFVTSPVDFLLFTIFRLSVLLLFVVLKIKHKQSWLPKTFLFFLGVFLVNWTFSLVKLLAFSEKVEQLTYFGLWFLIIWNVTAAVLLMLLWAFILRKSAWSYESLIANDISNTAVSNEEGSTRLDTFQHAMRLLRYCKNQWKWFSAGFLFLFMYSAFRIFIPYYTGRVITNIVQTQGFDVLVHSVLLMSALTLLSTLFGGLRGGTFTYATELVARQMRYDLFNSLVQQEIGFFDGTKTGEIISRLTSDCQTMSSTISTNINVFLRNGVMLLGSLIFMFALSWRLCLVTFIAVPIVAYLTKIYGSYYDLLSEKVQETKAVANHVAEEVISSMRTVRSFACEKLEVRRFEQHLESTLKLNQKKALAYMGYTWTNEFCDNAVLVAVLFYGGHLVLSGKMTGSGLISFLLYQLQLGENLYSIGYVFTGLMEGVGASRKVFEYMLRKPKVLHIGTRKTEIKGEVQFDSVFFTYPSRPNNPVLKDVTFTIHPGETVALVGPSGGGKSSIVSLIEHFYECNDGKVLIDGNPVADYDHQYIHQKIALVAQEPVLYEGSVRHNILYGCEWATEEDMLNASEMANVHDFIMETEDQYDTNCGEKGIQLSGGQKQRIAIARALVRRPAILILDEATSALDVESEHTVQEAIARCARNKTVIVIAHRLSTVENADRIIVISKGHVEQIGSHKDLLAQDGLYRSLVQRQLIDSSS